MPTFNAESYVAEAINSVLRQSYNHLQLIIVDDCSTDNTRAVIEDFAIEDTRLTVCYLEQNSGDPSRPRNMGMELAKGEFIAFIDCDDIWSINKLSIQMLFMQELGLDFSCTRVAKFLDGTAPNESKLGEGDANHTRLNQQLLLKKNIIATSTVVVRRSILQDEAFSEQREDHGVEDYLFWLQLHGAGNFKSGLLHTASVFYRVRKESLSRSKLKMALRVFLLLGRVEVKGKKLGIKRYYYFFTYLVGALKSSMYS